LFFIPSPTQSSSIPTPTHSLPSCLPTNHPPSHLTRILFHPAYQLIILHPTSHAFSSILPTN
jgi:hypothetical protein